MMIIRSVVAAAGAENRRQEPICATIFSFLFFGEWKVCEKKSRTGIGAGREKRVAG